MEEERTHREIELRSEEVQEVMGKIPPAILPLWDCRAAGHYGRRPCRQRLLQLSRHGGDGVHTHHAEPARLHHGAERGKDRTAIYRQLPACRKGRHAGSDRERGTHRRPVRAAGTDEGMEAGRKPHRAGGYALFHRIAELGSVQAAYSSCLLAWNNYLQHMQESRTYETEVANTVAGLLNAVAEWEKELSADSPPRMGRWRSCSCGKRQPVRGGGRDHVCHCPPRRSPSGGQGPAAHGGNRESPDRATGHHPVAGVSQQEFEP